LLVVTLALCAIFVGISFGRGIDVKIGLVTKVYSLGEPVELTIAVRNRFPARLLTGSWKTQGYFACETLSWAPGIDFSVYSFDRGALFFRSRLPAPEDYARLWIEPGEYFEVNCDLTQAFDLSQPGRYRAAAEVSGAAFRFDDSSWRRIWRRSVTTALKRLSERTATEFEVRRLSTAELVEVREHARVGEIAAIHILGAHQDIAGVEALDQVWTLPQPEVRREAALALAEIRDRHATDALGHGMELESDSRLKEEMASLMFQRDGLGAEPWIRKLAHDTVVFHDIVKDGSTYKVYRLRSYAKAYFEKLDTPIDVEVMEPW
jgi:hypothetical protein